MSVPNSLNVCTTAGETGMLFGHWFPPHITSLAGYINYIVNVRHSYEGDSICNEIPLIAPSTHKLELYTIHGVKDQCFPFRMVHKTLFYHSYLSSYRL